MSAAVFWIFIPIVFAFILLILRKYYYLSCKLQLAVCLILAFLAIFSKVDQTEERAFQIFQIEPVFNILGRNLVINSSVKSLVQFFYLFLGAWTGSLLILKIKSKVVPLGLPFIALLLSAVSVEPFLYSALILEIVVIIGVIMTADPHRKSNKGIYRYLIYFSFGMPFLLLAGWYLAGGEITPVNEEQLIQATLLLGLGFVFWLGVFPFHSWIPLIAEENRPSEGMFLLILMPIGVIVLLLKYLNGFIWLREYTIVYQAITIFGLIMVVTGAIWIFFQRKINHIVGYLLIFSTGMMLLSVGLNSSAGYLLSSYFIFLRLVTNLILAWILFIFERENMGIEISSLTSFFFNLPYAGIAFILAIFTNVGTPLTAGFPLFQTFYAYFAEKGDLMNITVISCIGITSIMFIRLSFLTFSTKNESKISLSLYEKILFISGILLLLSAGFFPNFFFPSFEGILNDYGFLVK